jgi:small nuclear ribonucleoprotein (snRNP)-like protein
VNQKDRMLLDESVDKIVRLVFSGGEIVTGKIVHIDLEYSDVIYDILETNKPEHYINPLDAAAYCTPLKYIEAVQKIEKYRS